LLALQRSRCNAVRHGLTAETVIGALEDAEDYKAFEASIIADYDAESAVERGLVLRLASRLLWRLRHATIMETGLFEIQAEHLIGFRQAEPLKPPATAAQHVDRRHTKTYLFIVARLRPSKSLCHEACVVGP
jgi:hypothetical protein